MWRFLFSPFRADAHRRSLKHLSVTDSAGFAGGSGLSSTRTSNRRRYGDLGEMRRPKPNSIEMKLWTLLFGLIILGAIILFILALTEESAHAAASPGTQSSLRRSSSLSTHNGTQTWR
jgi:hypothetical protein